MVTAMYLLTSFKEGQESIKTCHFVDRERRVIAMMTAELYLAEG